MHVDRRRELTQLGKKMYEQCFSMELKTIEKTLCLCRKPGPSSGNPAKGKEVMNKASEEARFLGGGPERSRIRLRLRACCHPTAV